MLAKQNYIHNRCDVRVRPRQLHLDVYSNYIPVMRKLLSLAALAAFGAHAQALPPDWHHGAFMEVFVRGYADSDGDGIGDLKGLTARLDYLQDLGVKGLWLMPVTASGDHDHGYATTDHRAIEPAYGTLADFDELLRQAARRGIGVVMDYVINHASAEHPSFQAARASRTSTWAPWFVWADTAPQGWSIWDRNPWYDNGDGRHYFAAFGRDMPDFDLRNPVVWRYHEETLRFWLDRGLMGYRLDAVPHLVENGPKDWNDQPESRRLTKRLQDLIKAYPHRYVVCEATAEPQAWGDPAVCGGAFAFGYVHHFVEAAKGSAESVRQLATYYRSASPTMATFVSNHDLFAGRRLWDQVGGDEVAYRLAAAGYLLQPGTPFIYYGEEFGQAGVPGLPGDGPIRAPMSWTADGGFSTGVPYRPLSPNRFTHHAAAKNGIHAFYRAMLALRNARPSIARGSFEHSFADGLVLGFQRRLGDEATLVLVNYGDARRIEIPGLPAGARLQPLYPADAGAASELPARSVRVYALR